MVLTKSEFKKKREEENKQSGIITKSEYQKLYEPEEKINLNTNNFSKMDIPTKTEKNYSTMPNVNYSKLPVEPKNQIPMKVQEKNNPGIFNTQNIMKKKDFPLNNNMNQTKHFTFEEGVVQPTGDGSLLDLFTGLGKTALTGANYLGQGIIKGAEGLMDMALDVSTSKANPYYWFNPDELKQHQAISQELIKKDSTNDLITNLSGDENFNQNFLDKGSLIKSDNLGGKVVTSIGQMLPSIATGGNLPGTLLLGAQSFGGGVEEAYNNGATSSEAKLYGLGSAATEIATEWITGGIPGTKSVGWLDNVVAKRLGQETLEEASESLTKEIIKYGYKVIGEGGEEALTEIINPLLKNLTYSENEKIDWNAVVESAIIGGLTGGILEAPANISNIKQTINNKKTNDLTNLNDNQNLPQSNLNTVNINEPINNTNQIQNTQNLELETINNNQNIENNNQLINNNIQEKYSFLPTNNKKSNNLRQSASKYFLNTQETIDMVNTIDKVIQDKDYNVVFDDSIKNKLGNPVNAQITNKNGEIEIKINPNSSRAVEFLLTHEITHAIETNTMKDLVMNYASKNAGFNEALESLKQTYGTTEVSDEVLADISGQLFGNQEFINSLSMQKPNVFKRIYNKIVELANKITGNSKEGLFIRNLKNKWETAYRNTSTEQTISNLDVEKNSQKLNGYYPDILVNTSDITKFNIKNINNLTEVQDKIYNYYKEKYISNEKLSKPITNIDTGMKIEIWKNGIYETFGNQNYYKKLSQQDKKMKLATMDNLAKMIKYGEIRAKDAPNKHNPNSTARYYYLEHPINIDGTNYMVNMDIRKVPNTNGRFYIHSIDTKKIGASNGTSATRLTAPISVNNVSQNNQNVNSNTSTKYSMQENINNTQELDNSSFSYDKNELKSKQLDLIQKTNPMLDDYHTGIRSVEDIKTFDEVLTLDDEIEGQFAWGDYTREDAIRDLKNGEVTIYSSYPIKDGVFVSTSYVQAQEYAGGRGSKVYSKTIKPNDVAWINGDEGQYAKVKNKTNKAPALDNQGRKLTKEQQDYFKNSKVRDAKGKLLTMYRGGDETINVFDRSKSKKSNLYGTGFYFTDSYDMASLYGDIQEVYLNIINPINGKQNGYAGDKTLTKEDVRKFLEYVANNEDYSIENYGTYNIDEILDKVYDGKTDFQILRDINATAIGDFVETIEKYNEINGTNYDGIITDSQMVVFNSNQIKNVDNTNPTADEDIRYSKQDNKWQEHLEQNYKASGTRTDMSKLKGQVLSKFSDIENKNTTEQLPTVKKELPKDPTKESSYDADKKLTRKEVRANLLDEMQITESDLENGNDIKNINFQITDPIRVNEKVFGKEIGQKINDATINKTKHNEAEKIRWLNKERDELKELGIKARSKESAAVQKYGEKQYVNDKGEVIGYGDIQLASEFPNIETQNKIKKAAQIIRNKYDNYIDQTNNILTSLGYDEIPKRKDYMRHFQELGDVFSQTGIPFNLNDMKSENLPTDINGLTDEFKPGKNWFASSQRRTGKKTTYDAITGIDGYLEGAGNLIYHTEDVQRYRALSEMIRNTYGQQKGFDNLENLSNEEVAKRIEDIQNNKLSEYVAWLDEQANSLAGKKGKIDRGTERMLGRKGYAFLNTLKKQVGSNMTGFNIRSSLTNLISTALASSKTNKIALAKGTVSTISNMFKNDNFANKSDFLTSRFGSDQLSTKLWQKISNAGQIFMSGTDYFTSNIIVRSKYHEGLSKGMSEAEAIKYADDFASRVMGDRSKGATAEIFNSKTLGLLTQFQLEVNNQWQYMIHDTKTDYQNSAKTNGKARAGATALFQMGQLAAYSYFFNELFEGLTGSRATFDPIEIIKTLFGADDEEEKSFEERVEESTLLLLDNIPFGSLLTGEGRIPISEALPINELITGEDEYGNDKSRLKTLGEVLPYYVMPTGYSQAKKTIKGASMYNKKLPTAGSYTDSGNLRFTADKTPTGIAKALTFGQYSSKEAQDYIDSGFKTINKNQIEEMKDLGMTSSEYRNYRKGLANAGSKNEEKLDYINNLNVSTKQKNIMANNVVDSKKYKIEMSDYNDYDSYEEMKYSLENPEKYNTITSFNIKYDDYKKHQEKVAEIKEKYSGTSNAELRKSKVKQYIESLPYSKKQKIMLYKSLGNYSINDYKEEMFNYIESLKITKKEKQDIWKQLYGSR